MPVDARNEVLLVVVEHLVEPLSAIVEHVEPGLLALEVLVSPHDAVHDSRLGEVVRAEDNE